jgi:AcrR family transcriptional regulator
MPRPPLTRERIVSAGISIVNEMGLLALTLRGVARRVNATPTGVQRLIGLTELRVAVVNEILASMPTLPARGSWDRRLRAWANATRLWLREYPGLARHLLLNRWQSEAALDQIEDIVRLLHDRGLPSSQSVKVGRIVFWYVHSATELDQASRSVPGADFSADLIASGADRWPLQLANHGGYGDPGSLAQFNAGFDLLLAGIEQLAPKRVVGTAAAAVGVAH